MFTVFELTESSIAMWIPDFKKQLIKQSCKNPIWYHIGTRYTGYSQMQKLLPMTNGTSLVLGMWILGNKMLIKYHFQSIKHKENSGDWERKSSNIMISLRLNSSSTQIVTECFSEQLTLTLQSMVAYRSVFFVPWGPVTTSLDFREFTWIAASQWPPGLDR